MCTFTLRYRLLERKRAKTIAVAIAITIWEEQFRKEAMKQSTKLIQKLKQKD